MATEDNSGPPLPPRVRRRIWIALGASVLLHALLLVSGERWWRVPLPEVLTQLPPPIEAVIRPAPKPPEPAKAAERAPPPPAPAPRASAPPPPEPAPTVQPQPAPASVEPAPAESAAPEVGKPAPPPGRTLPRRVEARYALITGEEGLQLGGVYGEWTLDGNRYALRVVAEAEGLMALFFTGQVIAESRGTVGDEGLRPDLFLVQRGALEKTEVVQFNWNTMSATMTSAKGTEQLRIRKGVQDQLSFFFQFTFAYPGEGEYLFNVLTGRVAATYTYRIEGEEQITTVVGSFKTVRVERRREPDARSVDAWLAVEYYHLPVRLRLTDRSGQTADLMLIALRVEP
jgi:hypothetical protein